MPNRLVESRIIRVITGGISRRAATRAFVAAGVFAVLACAVMTLVASRTAIAAPGINKTINFQGKVVNSNGTNVANGSYSFTFSLYTVSSGGSNVWTETKSITVTDGIFQTNLGSATSLPGSVDFNTDNIYLGIVFNGDPEMSPRIQFSASPYSFNSDLLDGLDASAFAQLNPASAQTGSLNVTGSVQAATSLQAPLVDTATAVAMNVGTVTASSVTVGRATSTTNLTLQGSASTTWSATGASGTTTVGFAAPTTTNAITFPNAGGTVCTTVSSTCSATYQVASATGYLAKNAMDTSAAAVTIGAYLYGFTNNNGSPTTGGVLQLSNGSNTGSTLHVTSSATPTAGAALITANQSNAAATGNLIDLQLNGTSQFAVDYDGSITQDGGTATTDTINGQRISAAANFTGTVTVATSVIAPLLRTGDVTGASAALTVRTGNSTTSGASGDLTLASGTTASGASGSVSLDSGVATGGAAGAVNVGTGAFAHNVAIGNTSGTSTTTLQAGSGNIVLAAATQVATLGTTNNAAFLCRNASSLLAACNTTGSGAAFVQGGNSFGAAGDLGTNDSNALNIRTNNATRLTVSTTGSLTWAASSTGDFDHSASTGTFATGTGAVSLNGDTTVAVGKKLGVGVVPTNKFQVALGTNEIAQLNDDASTSAIWGQNIGFISQSAEGQIVGAGSTPFVFKTGGTRNSMTSGTERLRINATDVTVAAAENFTVAAGATSLTGAAAGSSTAAAVLTGAASNVGLSIQAASSQTADLLQLKDSSGSSLLRVDSAANIESLGYIDTPYGGTGLYGNLLVNSEQLDQSGGTPPWTTGGTLTVTPDNTTAPDGQASADRLAGTGSSTLSQTYTTSTAGTYTFSVWLKQVSGAATSGLCIFAAGGATPSSCSATAVTPNANTWQRFSVTTTVAGTTTSVTARILPGNGSTATVQAWGAQLVLSSTPQVYTRTTVTTVAATHGVVTNGSFQINAVNGQATDLLRVVDGAGNFAIRVFPTGTIADYTKPTSTGATGALELGSSATQTTNDINGVIGFVGSGVQNAQIAYAVGDGFYLCNSSAGSSSGDYGQCASRVNLYGGFANFNGGLSTTTVTASGNITGGGTFQTAAAAATNGLNLWTGNSSAGASGALVIKSGDATGGNSGNISIDNGSSSGGTTGQIFIGGTNASQLNIGRSGAKFFLQGSSGATGSTITATSGANTVTVLFQDPTVNGAIYRFMAPSVASTTYNICTSDTASCGGASGAYVALQGSTPGTAQTGNINVSGTGIFGGNLTVGTAGSNQFTNNGSTLNTALALGDLATGNMGASAAATVNVYTAFTIAPAASGRSYTPFAPTSATAGRVIYVSNIHATSSFTLVGNSSVLINPGVTATLVWNGAAWTFAGTDASSLQAAYNNSASPEILLSTAATAGITVRDNATPISGNLLEIQNSGGTTDYFAVTSAAATVTGNILLGKETNRTIQVNDTTTTATAGANLTVRAANGVTTGQGGILALAGGQGGNAAGGGSVTVRGGASGGGSTAGGNATLQGGAASATAGSNGGTANLLGGDGSGTGTGGTGGDVAISGGNSFGSNARIGGAVTLFGGQGSPTGAGGAVTVRGGSGGSTSGVGGLLTLQGGNATAGTSAGGGVTIVGGTALGNSAAGAVSITGGAAAATAGSTGGTVTIASGAGTATGTGAAGSLLALNGGAAGGTGANAGGGITLTGGAATGAGAGGVVTLQGGTAAAVAGSAGGAVTITGRTGSGTGTGGVGGTISITAGAGGGTNSAGGNITLTAGNGGGTGIPGVVSIDQSVFTASATQSITATTTLTQSLVDNNSTIPVDADTLNGAVPWVVSVPTPLNTAVGRIIYITGVNGSLDFTLRPSGSGSQDISMKANSTATLVFNGVNWTAAGADASTSLQQVYNNTAATPASIVTGSATKNILFQAGATFDNANLFAVANSVGATLLSVDTTNTAASLNLAVNSGGETAAGFTTTYPAAGFGSNTAITQTTTAGEFASGTAAIEATINPAAATAGIRANLGSALATSRVHVITFLAKVSTGTWSNDIDVRYNRTGTTSDGATAVCSTASASAGSTFNTRTVTSTEFTKITCYITTSVTAGDATANIVFFQTASSTRNFYIDNISVVAQNTTGTQDSGTIRVGGPLSQGLTLLTLDSYAAAPFTGTANTGLLGSIYYDTGIGRIQCYEADGWGACGSSPNNSANLVAEYPGAVLNGTGIGTMTANLCANSGALSGGAAIQPDASLCASGELFNYYRWTSPQATNQTYSIFVRYQLPATFSAFLDDNTIKMTGRIHSPTSTLADGSVSYSLYKADGSQCGSLTPVTTALDTWQQVNLSGSGERTVCSFTANEIILFKIDVTARNNATVYASNIVFTTTGL